VLVELLRTQPAVGIAALYDHYGRLVYTVALRIAQDHGAAEEITQDVFVRCWRGIDRYEPGRGGLGSWLLAIAHHRAVDELRSRRGQAQRRELTDEHLALRTSDEPELDELVIRDEVKEALGALPQAQREVIAMVFWGGLTRREAAEQLQVPLGTVHTRLRLGMEKLRTVFARFFED
jgi:RNA polymerase sigma-70 factor (ECF subfamily)